MKITVTLLAKNSERFLKEVLEPLSSFDEVILYDNGSTDKTLEIAKSFPFVTVHQGPFMGFGETHNHVSGLARNDWIFSLDTDEIVTPELIEEIKSITLDPKTVYAIPRHNEYRRKWIKGCGWYPDNPKRLYNRKETKFSSHKVHESIISDGMKVQTLKNFYHHLSYNSVSEFIAKMQHYSDLFAQDRAGKVASSPFKAMSHALYTFFKCYILKRGFLDGSEGYLISSYNAHTAFYKYYKLYEANQDLNKKKIS